MINIDPEFNFDDICENVSLPGEKTILKRDQSILHIRWSLNNYYIESVFSKSLLPSYDPQGASAIDSFLDNLEPSLQEQYKGYITNSFDKDFVEKYYNTIKTMFKSVSQKNNMILIINYAVMFNQKSMSLYYGIFRELLQVLSEFPDACIYEYTNYSVNSECYSCIQIKTKMINNKLLYKAVNTYIHNGTIPKCDLNYTNQYITVDAYGKIYTESINTTKTKTILNY